MTIAGMGDDELLQVALDVIDDDPRSHNSVDDMRYGEDGEDGEEAQSAPRPSRQNKTVSLTELGCVALAHCPVV